MFRLYKTSDEIANSDDEETEENEDNEEDISIEDQLNKLSKLLICLCRQTEKGELEYVSNFVVTDLIEESEFIAIPKNLSLIILFSQLFS
jgi:hypothetical protein